MPPWTPHKFLLSLPDSSSFFRITWSTLTLIFRELRWPHANACIIAPTFNLSGALISPCKQKHLRCSVRPLSHRFKKKKKKKRFKLVVSACLYFYSANRKQLIYELTWAGSQSPSPVKNNWIIAESLSVRALSSQVQCVPVFVHSFFSPCFTSSSHTSQYWVFFLFFFSFCTSQSVTSGKGKKN